MALGDLLLVSPTMKLGERIRRIRVQAGLTQVELGRRIGTSSQAISNWESGRDNPSRTNLLRVASALGVTLTELLQPNLLPEQNSNGIIAASRPLFHGGRLVPVVPHVSVRVADKQSIATKQVYVSFPCGKDTFGIVVWDEANSPTYPKGTYLFFDPDRKPDPGNWVVATFGDVTVIGILRYETTATGTVAIIQPTNTNWPSWRSDAPEKLEIQGVKTEAHLAS